VRGGAPGFWGPRAGGMRRANAPRMHNVLFSLKRTFHKSTWLGRAVLVPYQLTPSRFDILYSLHKTKRKYLWQSAMRRILGVSAATTSILMRALVKLGFVRRRKSDDDRRQLEVSLTVRGRDFIKRAIAALHGQKLIDYFVRRIVVPKWWDADASFGDIDRV